MSKKEITKLKETIEALKVEVADIKDRCVFKEVEAPVEKEPQEPAVKPEETKEEAPIVEKPEETPV